MALHDGRAHQRAGRVGRLQEDRGQCPRHDVDVVVGRLEEAHIGQEVVGVGDGQDGRVVPDGGQQRLQPTLVDHHLQTENGITSGVMVDEQSSTGLGRSGIFERRWKMSCMETELLVQQKAAHYRNCNRG